ncbi:MAG: stage 0 sporulation protein, partial [Thermoplasmata archaeon]|nr:stage 0 sporulation protein [Thermoplasmata archaeon]
REAGLEKIKNHNLPMKLIGSEYSFDRSRIIFYFTSDGRVDFRELVKDLAATFKSRIELRQIGVRDEAKMVGGLGPCGRTLCCTTFLKDFEPINIRMAKDQRLSLNPSKISGVCGRLMCCLRYEHKCYRDMIKDLPELGAIVTTPLGTGKVVDLDPLASTVVVKMEDERQIKVQASETSLHAPTPAYRKKGRRRGSSEPKTEE